MCMQLKRELSVMTIAVASLCDLYCVVVLSPQVRIRPVCLNDFLFPFGMLCTPGVVVAS